MNILYYFWNENSAEDIEATFTALGHNCIRIAYPLSSYDADAEFEAQMHTLLQQYPADLIYTFNYFPILSKIAMAHDLPYAAWVYDCPNLTIYSGTITNPCNYLFLFDRQMQLLVRELGAAHAFHLPLAVNTSRLNRQLSLSLKKPIVDYAYNVSFVGSLYEQNMYDQIQYLPEYLRGYFNGLIASQQQIWGCSFTEDLLTPDILEETLSYVKLEDNPNYSFTAKDILANMLNQKITSTERIHLLNKISDIVTPDIFTGSDPALIKNSRTHGFISYTGEMPGVFCHSKINLNISLRSITSGIPLRCMDILGAGGFLLSNYQPELTEFFVPDEDFVLFESEEDLAAKIEYYLSHEAQRKEIAQNGWQKVQSGFSYEKQLQTLLSAIYEK